MLEQLKELVMQDAARDLLNEAFGNELVISSEEIKNPIW